MKRPVLVALSSLLVVSLFLCGCSGKQDTEAELRSMTPESRAKALLDALAMSFSSLSSFSVDTSLSLSVPDAAILFEKETTRLYTDIDQSHYAYHAESETSLSCAGSTSSFTRTEGYRDGTFYFSCTRGAVPMRLCCALSLGDYLAFEETRAGLLLPAFSQSLAESVLTSRVEDDGSYTVSIASLNQSKWAALREPLSDLAEPLAKANRSVTDVSLEIRLTRKLLPEKLTVTFLLSGQSDRETEPAVCTLTESYRDINEASRSALSLDAYSKTGDLRALFAVSDALSALQNAASGAFTRTELRSIRTETGVYLHRQEHSGTYSVQNGEPIYLVSLAEDPYLREIGYQNGVRRTLLRSIADKQLLSEQASPCSARDAKAELDALLDPIGYAALSISAIRAEDSGVYVFELAAPDLSDFSDLIGEADALRASATLTVTLADGKLTETLYRIELSDPDNPDALSGLFTVTCTYYDIILGT